MKILIWGGSGVISGYLPEAALQEKYEVTCICRGNKMGYIPQGTEILKIDCNDEIAVKRVLDGKQFDVTVDFLSFFQKDIAIKLKALRGKVKHYIFISSACVYTSHDNMRKFVESDEKENMWDYAVGKMACEAYLSEYGKKRGIAYTIVRPPITYGVQRIPFQINSFLNSYSIVLRMKADDPILMAGDGNNYHTFTHSWDFCRILVKLFLNEKAFGEDVHITSGVAYTWNEVLEYIVQTVKIKPEIVYLPPKEIESSPLFKGSMMGDKARNMLYDNRKMQSMLQEPYNFSVSLEQGIRQTYNFMSHHRQFQQIDRYWNGEIDKLVGNRKKTWIMQPSIQDQEIKYYIEWNGRYSRDFVYVMEKHLSIAGYIVLEKEKKQEIHKEDKLYFLSDIKEKKKGFYKVIICRSPKTCREEDIEKYGICYKEEWEYAEDMLYLLDYDQLQLYLKKRKLVLWGAGQMAKDFLSKYPFVKPAYFVDSDEKKQGTYLLGSQIYSTEHLAQENLNEIFLIVTAPYEEIRLILENMGWKEGENFVEASVFRVRPSELMRKILDAPTRTDWQCRNPFEHVRLTADGNYTYCYCADHTQVQMGKMQCLTMDDYQNSSLLRVVQLSVLNGTYIFCDENFCSMLRKQLDKKMLRKDYEYPVLKTGDFPLVTDINIDRSCNLYCASCRRERIICHDNQRQKLTEKIMEQILPKTEILFIAGDGEVFASNYYRQILYAKQYRKLQGIIILSNGNICREEDWNHIIELVDGNVFVAFSVDAATQETYKKLRRGGDFRKVETHIRYLSQLKKTGKIRKIALNFVIQKENYQELEAFVSWGKNLGADYFNITFLDNWGLWTEEEFRNRRLYETKENVFPELQNELDKLKKYGKCIMVDAAYRFRQIAYASLKQQEDIFEYDILR